MQYQRLVLGGFVEVSLPDLGISSVQAKVDTGAFSGALHCTDIHEEDGELFFTPLGEARLRRSVRAFTRKMVRSASGHETVRYLISTTVAIEGKTYLIWVGLDARPTMKFKMLLGRRFLLDHEVMVDVRLTKDIDQERNETP